MGRKHNQQKKILDLKYKKKKKDEAKDDDD